jgi:hypothetical protein
MMDGQIANSLRRRKTNIYPHTPAAIRIQPQAAPAQQASTSRAEQDLER